MPAKKRQRRKDARPEEIIAAALQEFALKGYAGTTIAGIAARADIARSTVYLYFPDKEALIRHAFEDRIGAILDNVHSGPLASDAPFEAAFRQMLELIYDRLTNPENLVLLRVLIAEGAQFPELSRFYHDVILKRAEGMLGQMIGAAIQRGEVRPEIADYDLKLIIAPVMISAIWRLTFHEIEPLDMPRFVDGHVDILTWGLLRLPPGDPA